MVQYIRAVRSRKHDDAFIDAEAIHLYQQLIQCLFSFIVTAAHTGAALTSYGIYLIDKYDTRCVLFGLIEQITDTGSTDAYKHFHKIRTGNTEERNAGFTGHRPGQQGLTGTGRTVQQHAFGNLGSQGIKPLRML